MFQTKKHKTLSIVENLKDNSIVYRYGPVKKVELEYPKSNYKMEDFIYSFYIRGGAGNDSLDLNYLRYRFYA